MPNIEQVIIRNNFKPLIDAIERVVEIPIPRTTVFCLTGKHRSEALAEWLFSKKKIVSLTPNNLMGGKIIGCSYKYNYRKLMPGTELAIFCFLDGEDDEDRFIRQQVQEELANCHRIDVVTTGTTCYGLLEFQRR